MTGPPTPPPSSATEIQDAARTSVPPQQGAQAAASATELAAPAAQPAPEQVQPATDALNIANQTSYELIFPSLVICARSGTTRELIQLAERGDLNVRFYPTIPTRFGLISIYAYARVHMAQTTRGCSLWRPWCFRT